jgi:hypothetical protein
MQRGRASARLVMLVFAAVGMDACAATSPAPPAAPDLTVKTALPAVPHPGAPAMAGITVPALPRPTLPHHGPTLVGLSTLDVTDRLGRPNWTRRDAPATVWQYLGPSCILDLYIYDDAGVPRVIYAEARDAASDPIETATCLERIEGQRHAPPTS